ncbi:hypothetical protein P8452_00689 [Trifolium repens]|nr:hypothetical protein P8452_00689 [Trifolium repens]
MLSADKSKSVKPVQSSLFFRSEFFLCVQKSRNVQLEGGEATILPDQIRQETLNVQNADRLASLHIREVWEFYFYCCQHEGVYNHVAKYKEQLEEVTIHLHEGDVRNVNKLPCTTARLSAQIDQLYLTKSRGKDKSYLSRRDLFILFKAAFLFSLLSLSLSLG